jgi:Bacterial regulatory helix-turn-helix protein, lysR family
VRDLDVDLLRYFVQVVELDSFALAGHELGRTPSAVNLKIRRLEQAVGQPLIKRGGKGRTLKAVFNYSEMFYNPQRRHAAAGNLSPAEFERRHSQRPASVLKLELKLAHKWNVAWSSMVSTCLGMNPNPSTVVGCWPA